MTVPLISILIPTRDRADTLALCLKAMRLHRTRDLEIVVVDTSRTGSARAAAAQAAELDDRVRYVSAAQSTSQRHSFELALAAARGDYLAIIGDDDGYVLGSLDWLADRLKRTPVDAVRWYPLLYIWPSLSQDGAGFFDIELAKCNGGSAILPAAPLAARNLVGKHEGSWSNILVYHGMISRGVYERMKARLGGTFFAYPMADTFAHNLLPFACDSYLQVNDFVSIYGMSHWSANASWSRNGSGEEAAEANRWMDESKVDELGRNQPWHPELRTLRYHDFVVFRLGEAHGLTGGQSADQQLWTRLIIEEIKQEPWKYAAWLDLEPKAPFDAEIIAAVRRRFGEQPLGNARMADHLKAPNRQLPSLRVRAVDPDLPDTVEGAMLAVEAILGSDAEKFEAPAPPEQEPPLAARIVRRTLRSVRGLAPGTAARIMHSPVMPVSLWRLVHRLYSGRMPGGYGGHGAQQQIKALGKAGLETSPATDQARADSQGPCP